MIGFAQLTPRALILLLVTSLWLAGIALTPLFGWVAALWLAGVLGLFAADLRLSPRADHWQVSRSHDDRLSLAAWNRVEVQIYLRRGHRPVHVWMRDDLPPTFGQEPATPLLSGQADPGELLTLTYHINPPRRGDYAFGDTYVRWRSALGLYLGQARFETAAPVKVYPNLVDVRKYDLLLRRNRLWELGLRNARIFGSGTEFESLRDYLPDDEYRRINWAATARRGRPISVEYETERSQNIMALLDVGRMMRSPVGAVAKLDYAINAVLLLAYVATQKGDRLGLLTFADQVQNWLAPRGGKGQFLRMLELLYAVEGEAVEPDYNGAFAYLAANHARRSLVILFTDLTGSVSAEALVVQMRRIRRQHLPLLVTISDPTVERLARQPITDSATLYERTEAERLLEERRLTLDRLRSQGVLTLDVAADELSVSVINRYLALKAKTMI